MKILSPIVVVVMVMLVNWKLHHYGKIGNSEHNNNLKMLTVKKDFKFSKDSEKEDTKQVKFKLKQNYIIDNLKDCIKVYIN